ncbi:hypothetical protein ACOCEA_06740 [Maribacter sp. CXY002]|uniref:hypothetical protein n=1 Tax=Maribacter luteocoastalis TaxID=3407671 RepID=UPI003B671441
MENSIITVDPILNKKTQKKHEDCFTVCLLGDGIASIQIDDNIFRNAANSIYFLHPKHYWEIINEDIQAPSGYILYLTPEILNNPVLSKLHINEVRLFSG